MELAKIIENKEKGHIYGLMGNINITTNNINISIVTNYKFKGTVEEYLNNSKAASSLKMVMLNDTYLSKNSNECSISELKKINFAKALIENKDCIVLNYFDKELNNQEKKYFNRLFKKLTSDYKKTIIIFTNDITFFWNIAKELILVDKYQVINTIPKSKYFDFMENINEPQISQIISLIKEKGINIDNYTEISDLLKAIYRIKEQK